VSTAQIPLGQIWAIRGEVVVEDAVLPDAAVVVEKDAIVFAGLIGEAPPELAGVIEDARVWDGYILPGLVDAHCHGGGGQSFPNAASAEEAMIAVMEHRRHGTTSLVASLVTDLPEELTRQTSLLAELCESGELAAIHLEGPFLDQNCAGAQDPAKMEPPNPDLVLSLAKAARGHLATMTLAPELPGVVSGDSDQLSVIQALAAAGAVPCFGHTECSPHELRLAIDASVLALARAAAGDLDAGGSAASAPEDGGRAAARASRAVVRSSRPVATHMFNGMPPVHHRRPGPALECLAQSSQGGLAVELIADGVHLDPDTVRDVFAIAEPGTVLLVTDAMAAAGMPDGSYQLGPMAVTVADGVARIAGSDSIAGSTSHLIDAVRSAVFESDVPVQVAVRAASATPARVLGIGHEVGSLMAGRRADLILADRGLTGQEVYRAGALV
jgi:N-acetylglucosamine-6-phosphate deacetylase